MSYNTQTHSVSAGLFQHLKWVRSWNNSEETLESNKRMRESKRRNTHMCVCVCERESDTVNLAALVYLFILSNTQIRAAIRWITSVEQTHPQQPPASPISGFANFTVRISSISWSFHNVMVNVCHINHLTLTFAVNIFMSRTFRTHNPPLQWLHFFTSYNPTKHTTVVNSNCLTTGLCVFLIWMGCWLVQTAATDVLTAQFPWQHLHLSYEP